MANVPHSTLTGAELHEPKGADSAATGTVYVANGAGSGSWQAIGTSAFTGQIADFAAPVAPSGWLECDGSTISTTTYSALFAVMSISSSGTRSSGSAIVTSVPSTTNFRVGYYVYGTGIATGTTILTIDSSTQITMSGNASSSGTATIYVSPWELGSGTIKLPDLTTAGRYRRSRTSSTKVGDLQADQNQSHTHSFSATTSSDGDHTHTATVTDPGHTHGLNAADFGSSNAGGNTVLSLRPASIGIATTGITVANSNNGAHTHVVSGTSGSNGGTEARPLSVVLLTCIKT